MTRVLVLLFAVVLMGLAAAVGAVALGETPSLLGPLLGQTLNPTSAVDPEDSTLVLFTVHPGDSAADIATRLQEQGLIRSALGFRLAVERKGVGNNLNAGEYELNRSLSAEQIVDVLARGQVKRGLVVTIPEGWRAEQIAARLDSSGVTSAEEFLRAVADPQTVPGIELLGTVPPTLEGYLFPNTYEVREKISGQMAAEMMIRRFEERAGDLTRSSRGKLTPSEVLSLASIVEREAQRPEERATIASVYLNRLAAGMPLQADPTVQFAAANADGPRAALYGFWKQDLTQADLALDSPYNTYSTRGLPPGPICSPGEPAIRAVIEPASTDFLYFVATSGGRHLFGRTLAEHNANIERAVEMDGAR